MDLITPLALAVGGGLVSVAAGVGVQRYEELQRGREAAAQRSADQDALGFRDPAGRLL